jgi:hypothetical protein
MRSTAHAERLRDHRQVSDHRSVNDRLRDLLRSAEAIPSIDSIRPKPNDDGAAAACFELARERERFPPRDDFEPAFAPPANNSRYTTSRMRTSVLVARASIPHPAFGFHSV